MLEGTTPIDTPVHGFKNIKEAREWAKDNITGSYKNSDTGNDILVTKQSIEKYLSQKAVEQSINLNAHLSALKVLPDLIRIAILRDTSPDKNNSRHILAIQRLHGAILHEGHTYPVKITVKVTKNEGCRAYTYEVVKRKKPEQL